MEFYYLKMYVKILIYYVFLYTFYLITIFRKLSLKHYIMHSCKVV